jgi:hypothetical protein
VRTLRIIVMVMLSILYVGGMYGHLSGAAFPIVGTGDKSLDHFDGRSTEPIHPTITDCRHVPLVKSVCIPLPVADECLPYEPTHESRPAVFPKVIPPPLTRVSHSFSCRAPPRL